MIRMLLGLMVACAWVPFVHAQTKGKPAPLPAVPEILKPFNARIAKHGALKDVALSLKVDEPMRAEHWAAIAKLPVKHFSLSGKGADDAVLFELSKLPVEGLYGEHPLFTDAGAKAFQQMPQLKTLLVHASKLTGKAAASLADHPCLEVFSSDERFGAHGMAHLATCKKLRVVRLYHGLANDNSVIPLAEHPTVESLIVAPLLTTGVSNEGVKKIATIPNLSELTLTHTVLTYADGLDRLKNLPKLTKLTLTDVAIAPADLEQLKSSLPKVAVTHTPMTPEYRVQWDKMKASGR